MVTPPSAIVAPIPRSRPTIDWRERLGVQAWARRCPAAAQQPASLGEPGVVEAIAEPTKEPHQLPCPVCELVAGVGEELLGEELLGEELLGEELLGEEEVGIVILAPITNARRSIEMVATDDLGDPTQPALGDAYALVWGYP